MSEQQNEMFESLKGDELLSYIKSSDLNTEHIEWPRTFAEIVDQTKHYLETHHNISSDEALKQATGIGVLLAEFGGGRMFYLPSIKGVKKSLRDTKIWHEFNGRNIAELCKRYDLTEMSIYTILKKQRALTSSRLQCDLFNGNS